MKQVISYLTEAAHIALKRRAIANKRSIGNQLLWEALHAPLHPAGHDSKSLKRIKVKA